MPRLPAICTNCGKMFQSVLAVEGGGTIKTKDCISGPCPFCGASGYIPDGVYSALATSALLFSSGVVVKNQIEQFVRTLKESIQAHTESEALSKQIKENYPELSTIADVLPKTRNELYLFLMFLVALATLLLTTCSSESNSPTIDKTNVNVYVNKAIEEANKSIPKQQQVIGKKPTKAKIKVLKRKRNKIARNSRKKNRK